MLTYIRRSKGCVIFSNLSKHTNFTFSISRASGLCSVSFCIYILEKEIEEQEKVSKL